MVPTTRRMSRISVPSPLLISPSDPTVSQAPASVDNEVLMQGIDIDMPPTPEKQMGCDTPMDYSLHPSSVSEHEEVLHKVIAALHRSDSEVSDEDDEGRIKIAMEGDMLKVKSQAASSEESSDEDKAIRVPNSSREPYLFESGDEVDHSSDEADHSSDSQVGSRAPTPDSEDGDAGDRPSAQATMPVPPPSVLATAPLPAPAINISQFPSHTYGTPSPPPQPQFLNPTVPPLSMAPSLGYDLGRKREERPAIYYQCSNARPWFKEPDNVLTACETVFKVRLGESLKCRQCGCPVVMKVRTNRMVQFEAR